MKFSIKLPKWLQIPDFTWQKDITFSWSKLGEFLKTHMWRIGVVLLIGIDCVSGLYTWQWIVNELFFVMMGAYAHAEYRGQFKD